MQIDLDTLGQAKEYKFILQEQEVYILDDLSRIAGSICQMAADSAAVRLHKNIKRKTTFRRITVAQELLLLLFTI